MLTFGFHPLGGYRPELARHIELSPLSAAHFTGAASRQDGELDRSDTPSRMHRADMNAPMRCHGSDGWFFVRLALLMVASKFSRCPFQRAGFSPVR
jgi:hypothetical protein